MLKGEKPIIVLEDVRRLFPSGEVMEEVLKGINLTINRGEKVAIVGASGSGKSTLMNILGCLDRPSSGRYFISGRETSKLLSDELSKLRRNHFGFIFQRYNLLTELSAVENVAIPAVYSGQLPHERRQRAIGLLQRLGIGERVDYRPNQLSGGQQQRVSIARALMNNGEVILADEPTGALDKKSGEEVLQILEELHSEGRTIIIVTHDMRVAERAERIIEISDGHIISDKPNKIKPKTAKPAQDIGLDKDLKENAYGLKFNADRFNEAFKMALFSMNAHRMRTLLTMLGIIIGIAAVVAMVALGNGAKQQVLNDMSALGSNTLNIFAGKSRADVRSGKITTLVDSDARALASQPYADGVTPTVSTSTTVRSGAVEANASLYGVGSQYFQAQNAQLVEGRLFDQEAVKTRSLELVIKQTDVATLFPDDPSDSPIGKLVLVGNVVAPIVGVISLETFGPPQDRVNLYLPYTSVQTRFLGTTKLDAITLRIAPNVDSYLAEAAVRRLLIMRHGSEDFSIRNSQEFISRVENSTQIFSVLVTSIAFISLIVGGIGVMNIMLVTVSERINEIGVRMAVGARRSDILQQFLIEAVLVCLMGGIIGIILGLSVGPLAKYLGSPVSLLYSFSTIVIAFLCSSLIGIIFGYLPARNASNLDPVVALARD